MGTSMAAGAAWMVILQSADRLLGFASTLVLARLLVPADFGLVALGMAIVGSLTAFSEFGFDLALIRDQTAGRKQYDTAWTLSVVRGLVIAALLVAVSKWNADLMGDDRLELLVYFLALVPFIEAFCNIGIVDFRKDLHFRKEFLYRLSARVGGVLVTIAFAFEWQNYWALVVGQLTASSLRLVLSYTLHPYRPRFSLAAWKELFHFSKWLFLNGLAQFASRRASVFVVGLFLTPAAVGLFSIAGTIMNTVSMALVAPVKRTFLPGFAKLTQDMAEMRRVLLNGYAITVLVSAPLSVGIGMTAEYFVPVAFGTKWLDTIPVIQVLVLSALANALQGPIRPLLFAINRPELVTVLSVVNAAIIIPALVVGTWLAGIEGAAWALVFENSAMLIVQHAMLRHFLQLSLMDVIGKIWGTLASCALMAFAVWALKTVVIPDPNAGIVDGLIDLTTVAAAGAAVYCVSVLAFWALSGRPAQSPEGIVLTTFRNRFLKAPPQPAGAVTGGEKTGS